MDAINISYESSNCSTGKQTVRTRGVNLNRSLASKCIRVKDRRGVPVMATAAPTSYATT